MKASLIRRMSTRIITRLSLMCGIAVAAGAHGPSYPMPTAAVTLSRVPEDLCECGGVDGQGGRHGRRDEHLWCRWRHCGCDMPMHYPYPAAVPGHYYFRPYSVAGLRSQQEVVLQWGGDPQDPYSNEIFDRVYKQLEAEESEVPAELPQHLVPSGPSSELPAPDNLEDPAPPDDTEIPAPPDEIEGASPSDLDRKDDLGAGGDDDVPPKAGLIITDLFRG